MTACGTCAGGPNPAIPRTPGAQAAYMAHMAAVIEAGIENDIPATVLADICRAVAIIGQGVARADEAYVRGLADGARGRRAAMQAKECEIWQA
jgi:hypothetical protein